MNYLIILMIVCDAWPSSLTTWYRFLTKLSKYSKLDDELFDYFDDCLQCKDKATICPDKGCEYLTILDNACARQAIAKYLVWFEHRPKYEQDLMVMEWYQYETWIGWYYLVPFDWDLIEDMFVLNFLQGHCVYLCSMLMVMDLGENWLKGFKLQASPLAFFQVTSARVK